jgi:hypothetical protein
VKRVRENTTFWISIASVVFSAIALTVSCEGNKIAQESAKRELRAYVVADGIKVQAVTLSPSGGARLLVRIPWKNFGQTPARDVQTSIGYAVSKGDKIPPIKMMPPDKIELGPSQWMYGRRILITPAVANAVVAEKLSLYIRGVAQYRDVVSDEKRETRLLYRVDLLNNGGFEWTVIGRDNCQDEECPTK